MRHVQIFGDSLYSNWFPIWILELAQKHSAVILCANHRMLPESSGIEVLTDIDDFWKWLHTDQLSKLLTLLSTPVELDLDRILTTGQSAGGLISLYLALTYPDEIRASAASYPQLNQESEIADYSKSASSSLAPTSGIPPPPPVSLVMDHVDSIKPGQIVTSNTEDLRFELFRGSIFHGKYLEFYLRGSEKSPVYRNRLFQVPRLEQPDAHLPRGGLVILHGRDDFMVPAYLSERYVKIAQEKLYGRPGADKIVLSIQDGGHHGFDYPVHLEQDWLQDALKGATAAWLE